MWISSAWDTLSLCLGGENNGAVKLIQPALVSFIGRSFEDICYTNCCFKIDPPRCTIMAKIFGTDVCRERDQHKLQQRGRKSI